MSIGVGVSCGFLNRSLSAYWSELGSYVTVKLKSSERRKRAVTCLPMCSKTEYRDQFIKVSWRTWRSMSVKPDQCRPRCYVSRTLSAVTREGEGEGVTSLLGVWFRKELNRQSLVKKHRVACREKSRLYSSLKSLLRRWYPRSRQLHENRYIVFLPTICLLIRPYSHTSKTFLMISKIRCDVGISNP